MKIILNKIEPEETIPLAHYINPTNPRVGIVRGMSAAEYRAVPAFNPSLVKKGAPEIKDGGVRGHITRILDEITTAHAIANGLPVGAGRGGDNGSRSKDMGSLYHQLLLEPDSFGDRYVMLTPEIQADLLAAATQRKVAEMPKYSGRLKEVQEFKAEHSRLPEDSEIPAIMEKVRERVVGQVEWHSRLTEFVAWADQQRASGRDIVTAEQVGRAQAMADAIHTHPANRSVAQFLESQRPLGADRVEASMFAVLEWAKGGSVALKGRPDIIGRGGAFLDPKSCLSAHPWDFARTVDKFGYAIQAGSYCLMSQILADEDHPSVEGMDFPKVDFGFLAQESAPPYLAKLYWLPREWIAYGKHRFLTIIRQTIHADESGDWSGNPDDYVFETEPDSENPGEMLTPPEYLMPTLEQFQ